MLTQELESDIDMHAALLPGIRRIVFVRILSGRNRIRYCIEAISDRGRPVSRPVCRTTAMAAIRRGAPFIVRSS